MNAGFQIGTGDLSELALGWCTYNADHMSMYNPNIGVPKTLVRFLVRFAADHEFDGDVRGLLHDVANTVISPELLPTTESGEIIQATEDTVGPYELHDFFLFHILRFGTPPEKVLFLATIAFDEKYAPAEIRRWLAVFLRRFFSSQFKRSCLPDGPKVGSVTLSPRGDWRMPSDAVATEWLKRVE
jgi:NAD+ synthase (glutamine-hydrolysing)